MSVVSVPDILDGLGIKTVNCDNPVSADIKPKSLEGAGNPSHESKHRAETTDPKIKLESDDEAEAQLTASITELEAALEAKVAAANTTPIKAPDDPPLVIDLPPRNWDHLLQPLHQRLEDIKAQAQARIAPAPPTTASAQSGAQRTATHNDNRFHPYQTPTQPVQTTPSVQPQPNIPPTVVVPLRKRFDNQFSLRVKPVDKSAKLTVTGLHIIIERCYIAAEDWAHRLHPPGTMTARDCHFMDGAHFTGLFPFVAENCNFSGIGIFKANQNFTAINCRFLPKDDRITMTRAVWNSCKDCVFHGEVYINKRPVWSGLTIDGNILRAK